MGLLNRLLRPALLQVFTDGAIRPEQQTSGLAAIVRRSDGAILYWWSSQEGAMTCNEAEYAAVVLALEALRTLRPLHVQVYCDSQVVVEQMRGLARVRSAHLRNYHARLRALTTEFDQVTFHHIPREQNRLADALANEAAEGGSRRGLA